MILGAMFWQMKSIQNVKMRVKAVVNRQTVELQTTTPWRQQQLIHHTATPNYSN
jgi:hypothetical protein